METLTEIQTETRMPKETGLEIQTEIRMDSRMDSRWLMDLNSETPKGIRSETHWHSLSSRYPLCP